MFVPNEHGLLTATMFINSEVIFALIVGLVMSVNGFNFMLRKLAVFFFSSSIDHKIFKSVFRILKSTFLLMVFVYAALVTASGSYNPFIYFRF
jgi:hypothetical protein